MKEIRRKRQLPFAQRCKDGRWHKGIENGEMEVWRNGTMEDPLAEVSCFRSPGWRCVAPFGGAAYSGNESSVHGWTM